MLYAKRFKGKKIISAHSTPNLNVGNIAFPRVVNWLYIPIYNRFDHIISYYSFLNSTNSKFKQRIRIMKFVIATHYEKFWF